MIIYDSGRLAPIPFKDMIDPTTGRTKVRLVDIKSESYIVARKYMIRLEKDDLEGERIKGLAEAGKMPSEEF